MGVDHAELHYAVGEAHGADRLYGWAVRHLKSRRVALA